MIDMMITGAAQLVTCRGENGPLRGEALRTPEIITDGAIAVAEGQIVAVGTTAALTGRFQARQIIDATGHAIVPGFVDPHTHILYAGNRVSEFEQRIAGATYQEIMAAGGGIVSTMKATRAASVEQLVAESRPRLAAMLRLGSTTVEVKSGYGLSTESELRMLAGIAALDQVQPVDLVPTFMGAHALPPEYRDDGEAYTQLVIDEMLPAVTGWYEASHFAAQNTPCFNDVFCEQNAFDLDQSRRILLAGQGLGLPAKIHADEFTSLGGVSLAIELEAVSVDHCDVTVTAEQAALADANTVAVILPAVNLNLGSSHFAPARSLVDHGAAIALSTDINPGSAPCPSQQLVMALACRYQRLLPAEALHASTINAAHAIGLGDRVGSLEAGKQADLLILAGDDYRQLAYQFGGNQVKTVIKRGTVVV